MADALGPLYTAGLVATTDQRPLDVINDLAQAMGGFVAFVGNQLRVRVGAYVAPVLNLDDDDFAGGTISVQVRQPRESTFNIITGKITGLVSTPQPDGTSLDIWQPDFDFPRVEAQAYIDADGDELPQDVTFNAVNRSGQAQQLAAVMLRYARQALTVVATFKLTAYPVELFDTIALTSSRYGWSSKAFVVMGRKWSLLGLIELTLRETDPTIYSFGDTFDSNDAAPNTNLPLSYLVQQLTGLAVVSGTEALSDGSIVTRTQVSWNAATDQSVIQNGKVEIQWTQANGLLPPGDWPGTTEPGGATETTIVGLQGGQAYIFRGRFIGLGGRVRGAWSSQALNIVAPPPQTNGSNLFINGSFEIDTANLADNWVLYTNGSVGTVTHSDATGIFGSRAQRLDCTALPALGVQAGYTQRLNLSGMADQTVTLSSYATGTTGVQFHLMLLWLSPTFTLLSLSENFTTHLTSTVQRATLTAVIPDGCQFCDAVFSIINPVTAGAAFMVIDGAKFEVGSTASGFSESADEAMAAAEAAQATADAAAVGATNALNDLIAIGSANVLTAVKKPVAILDYANLLAEQAGIDAQAVVFGITTEKTAYDTAITALTDYLASLSGWNTVPGSDVSIIRTVWDAKWSAVYTTRQTLLNTTANEAAKRAAWANVTGTGKPADNASADLVLIPRGQCVATGNSVTKVGGANAFDSDTYSKNGYIGGCFAGAQIVATPDVMFGLNSDPTTDESFSSLDYAWYVIGNGQLQIYESATLVASGFSYSAGDVLSIVYDGVRVIYMQNNTQRRSVAAAANLNLFWDSSFASPSGRLDQIRFGPLSAVTGIGNGQIVANAATDVLDDSGGAGSVGTGPGGSGATNETDTISEVTYTNATTKAVVVQLSTGLSDATVSYNGTFSALSVKLHYDYSINGGAFTRRDIQITWTDSATSGVGQSPGSWLTVTLNAGDAIDVRLRAQIVHTNRCSLNWGTRYMSGAAIKL